MRMSCSSNGVCASISTIDHFGKADGIERVGHRKLFEFFLDARAAAQAGGVVDAQAAVRAR